nr:MAG TPA: hypothetical protein [Caudoviricetes sp.]
MAKKIYLLTFFFMIFLIGNNFPVYKYFSYWRKFSFFNQNSLPLLMGRCGMSNKGEK